MRSRNLSSLILIIAVTGLAIWINFSPNNLWLNRDVSVRQGLDLQGGIQVLLRASVPNPTDEDLTTALGVLERRVNALGVGETVVQRAGNDRLIVELPGVDDPEQAVETLRGTGRLEFIDPQGNFLPAGAIVRTTNNPEPIAFSNPDLITSTLLITDAVFTSITDGADLDTTQVQPTFAQNNVGGQRPAVSFRFTGESATGLATFTSSNTGLPMCIVLDSVVVSCPVVQSALTDGSGIIETNSQADADAIFNQLKFGALPVPLQVETSRTISATLGQESVARSIEAGLVGLAIVAIFMIAFYRLPGLIAAIALLIYTAISFALFRLIPITLTLPGIAGFILSVGMAVDANVLIFARLREEYRAKRQFGPALEAGFEEAWSAIRDSSVSTLITSTVLFFFGNSFGVSIIKGFALNLGLGVVISLFTAVVVTRTLLRLTVGLHNEQRDWLFGLDKRIEVSEPKTAAEGA